MTEFLFKFQCDQGNVGKFPQNIKPSSSHPVLYVLFHAHVLAVHFPAVGKRKIKQKHNYYLFWLIFRVFILLLLSFNSLSQHSAVPHAAPLFLFFAFNCVSDSCGPKGGCVGIGGGQGKKKERMKSRTDSHLMWLEIKPKSLVIAFLCHSSHFIATSLLVYQ